jgi:hypothetical protein
VSVCDAQQARPTGIALGIFIISVAFTVVERKGAEVLTLSAKSQQCGGQCGGDCVPLIALFNRATEDELVGSTSPRCWSLAAFGLPYERIWRPISAIFTQWNGKNGFFNVRNRGKNCC